MVHGLKKRAMKCAAGLPTDRWIQFAKPDAQGELQPHETRNPQPVTLTLTLTLP